MQNFFWVSIVTLLFAFVLFGMSLVVSRLRVTTGIAAPAVVGDPKLEQAFRAHMNTVEWTPIALPPMWILAAYWDGVWAAIIGAVWVLGRIIYFVGYLINPEKRFIGMSIQSGAAFVLAAGALGRLIYLAP